MKNTYIPQLSTIREVIKHTDLEYTFRMEFTGDVKPGQFFEISLPKYGEAPISVSGIGPKAALSILSYTTPEGLALSIMNNDVRSLTAAPGIGKKIAQRVILELKDKIAKEMDSSEISIPTVSTPSPTENSNVSDAVTALTVLGYSSAEVAPILKQLDLSGMDAEQIIKAVLRHMVK